MKKIKIILITVTAVLIVSSNSFAQRGQSGNCISQGAVAFDAFYGYPYINGALLKALSSAPVHNTNHLGAKVEYMVSDNVGLGVEFTYADASVMYSDSTGNHTAGIRKYRILGKMNYHFATTSNVDPYFTVGAGVKNTTVYDNGTKGASISINLLPVAIRFGVGVRYFFTDFIGINGEVGLGGPMMQGGLSFKF